MRRDQDGGGGLECMFWRIEHSLVRLETGKLDEMAVVYRGE